MNLYIRANRYATNALYQAEISGYGIRARTVSGDWYKYTWDKPIVDVAKGSTDYKILHDQYGDSIQYNYGDNAVNNLRDNEFRGKNRKETNYEYQAMLSRLCIIGKSVGNLYQSNIMQARQQIRLHIRGRVMVQVDY